MITQIDCVKAINYNVNLGFMLNNYSSKLQRCIFGILNEP